MNKKTILLAVGIFMAAQALGSSTESTMGNPVNVPIHRQDEGTPSGRPHAPALPLFSAELNNNIEVLSIISVYEVGEVLATIENLSTGEYYEYSFDSSEIAVLPISCTEGFWRITLSIESGDTFVGEFEI